ncbi:MAG: hypothetical protein KOO62_03490 [candidate division Zixibacteria bacterium]|nr:hypothetical protein [candidate division Zixibacteria bacterium]
MPRSVKHGGQGSLYSLNCFLPLCSALLLCIPHVIAELQFISLFALVPYLWVLDRTRLAGSVLAGMLLATTYTIAIDIAQILSSPAAFFTKLFILNVILAVFGLTVNLTKRRIGFDPAFVAMLWIGLEYALIKSTGVDSIFVLSNTDSHLVVGFCSLFGFLLGSFVIVLVNSLTLIFLRYAWRRRYPRRIFLSTWYNRCFNNLHEVLLERRCFCFPDRRAPPIHTLLF